MKLKETTVEKHYLYRGKIVNFRCDDALLPDGTPCKREVVEHPGGASVLCVREGKILLVKQFRYAYGEELYEIPAGKLERGEDPAAAAVRELEEETGIRARVRMLYLLYPTPGYTNEKIYIYRAEGVKEGRVHLDDGEFLTSAFYPLEKTAEMIERGEIKDAKTVVAIQRVLLENAAKPM